MTVQFGVVAVGIMPRRYRGVIGSWANGGGYALSMMPRVQQWQITDQLLIAFFVYDAADLPGAVSTAGSRNRSTAVEVSFSLLVMLVKPLVAVL